jgi:hypothetical protein
MVNKEIFLGIIGSRIRNTVSDRQKVEDAYLEVYCRTEFERDHFTIVSGGAYQGADKFAVEIARGNGHKMITYFPNMSDVPAGIEGQGMAQAAYFARNEQIARQCDILIAAPKEDHCGTRHTIFRFRKLHPTGELIEV